MKVDKVDTIKKEKLKRAFLEALADEKISGSVHFACKKVGYSRAWMYRLRAEDDDFSQAWNQVTIQSRESLADFAESKLFEHVRGGNITAIIFTLKKLRPEKWGDKEVVPTPQQQSHPMSKEFYEKVYLKYKPYLDKARQEGKIKVKYEV